MAIILYSIPKAPWILKVIQDKLDKLIYAEKINLQTPEGIMLPDDPLKGLHRVSLNKDLKVKRDTS
jgi:hypothetical protein